MIRFLSSIAFTVHALAAACGAEAVERPNIVLILADDMGFDSVSVNNAAGMGPLQTPNIDRLAGQGKNFVDAHSGSAVCSPTRYGLLTGRYCWRTELKKEVLWDYGRPLIEADRLTVAELLKQHGYATAFFGKLHLGGVQTTGGAYGQFRDGPIDHGFEYSLTLPSGIQASPYAFFRNDRLSRWDDDKKDFVHFSSKVEAERYFNGQKMDNWSTNTVGPLLMHDALDYIDKHHAKHKGKKPFFIHYCSQAGHTPYVPPAHFNVDDPMDTSKGIPIKGRTTNPRTDMVHEADVAVGLFQKQLSKHGLWENTLFIFTSDNGVAKGVNSTWSNPIYQDTKDGKYGGTLTERAMTREARDHVNGQGVVNGVPLRGKKGYCYEGGHRVPLIMHWPERISARRETQLIALHDIYRTLAGLLTVPVSKTQAKDSVDFSDVVLSGSGKPKREKLMIQANRPTNTSSKGLNSWAFYWATTEDEKTVIWKCIINNNRQAPQKSTDASATELYNLTADPGESKVIKDPKRSQKMLKDYKRSL